MRSIIGLTVLVLLCVGAGYVLQSGFIPMWVPLVILGLLFIGDKYLNGEKEESE